MASVYSRHSRLDSYRLKKENSACQRITKIVNSTKLRTEIRMARNLGNDIALTARKLVMEAARRDPTNSVTSKTLNMIDKT